MHKQWLNDNIMHVYLRTIQRREDVRRRKVLILPCQFMTKIIGTDNETISEGTLRNANVQVSTTSFHYAIKLCVSIHQ